MEEVTVQHLYQQQPRRVRIKLEKGKGGQHSWEIDAEGDSVEEALAKIRDASDRLEREYGE